MFLAEDEASLYLQATTTAVWAPRGQTPVIRVHPGRGKVNFYGTLILTFCGLHLGTDYADYATKDDRNLIVCFVMKLIEIQ